jgi:hypothetical protein
MSPAPLTSVSSAKKKEMDKKLIIFIAYYCHLNASHKKAKKKKEKNLGGEKSIKFTMEISFEL